MRNSITKNRIMAFALFCAVQSSPSAVAQDTMKMPKQPAKTNPSPNDDSVVGKAQQGDQSSAPDGLHMMGQMGPKNRMEDSMKSIPEKSGGEADLEKFTDDPQGLPLASQLEIVSVEDGALITLTAAPVRQKVDGIWIRRLAYNGSVPGPVIKVKQGTAIRLVIANKMDVETTLHPHGLRTSEKSDGVVGLSQEAIKPGNSYEYALTFPDAGMFWYHAHVHEDYTQDAGLYGNFWVIPSDPNFYNKVHREVPLLLDDVQVGATAESYFRELTTHALTGRFGSVMLINGASDFTFPATEGEVVRFFLTNTANTRTINFRIPGLRLKLVGGDNGLYEHETWVNSVTIGPSERYIIEVQFPKRGIFEIVNEKPVGPPTRLGKIDVREGKVEKLSISFATLRTSKATASAFKDVKAKLSLPVTHELRFDIALTQPSMSMAPVISGTGPDEPSNLAKERGIEWEDEMAAMNAASTDKNVVWKLIEDSTKRENMDIKWTFKKGDFVKVRLFNDPKSQHPMQHPIHFHGQRFVIAEVNGKPTENLVWKDTVLVPEGDTVDIVLELSNAGRWLAHCHIAEHLSAGMVMGFTVLDQEKPLMTH